MKIVFNDAAELQIQSYYENSGQLQIKTISTTRENLKQRFSDKLATKKMIIKEREQVIGVFESYTDLYRLEEYTGGILGVLMYQEQKTPEAQAEVQAAAVEVARLQAQYLSDTEALTVKAIYPLWREVIGKTVDSGFKFVHEGVLYKNIQDKILIQEQYVPGTGTESLYTVINETCAGTVSDPIPYNNNMELEAGKYYIQNNVVYYCNRSTGQPVYNELADLVGLYVEVVKDE